MEQSSYYLLRRFVKEYIRKYTSKILIAVLFMFIYAGTNSAQALLLESVFDKVFIQRDEFYVVAVPLAIIFVFVLMGVSNYISNIIMSKIGYSIINKMQKRLFGHFVRADMETHYRMNTGEILSRITSDIGVVRNAVNTLIVAPIKQGLTFLGLVGVMFYQNWKLSLISLGILFLVIFPILRVAKRLKKLARQWQQQSAVLMSKLTESLKGVRVVKSYQKEEYEIHRLSVLFDKATDNRVKSIVVSSLNGPIMSLLAGVAVATVIWYASGAIDRGEFTPGGVVSFIGALVMATRPLRSMTGMGGTIQNSIVACERFFAAVDSKEVIEADKGGELKVDKGEIKLENVLFRYPTQDEDITHALKSINITIPAGKRVALVGHSGSGKSTIMNLLLKFFVPEQGKILIDGQDIADANIRSLRKHMSLVTQDIFLFDDTITANIKYGNDAATDEQVREAARMAAADEFISKLPQGYNTLIGEDGVRLSGGQKQRISIARAILRDTPILLLDEATSALDTVAEREFQSALEQLMVGKTTVMIAHRLSTVLSADLIYVLDNGNVVDSGTHAELIERSDVYRRLYNL